MKRKSVKWMTTLFAGIFCIFGAVEGRCDAFTTVHGTPADGTYVHVDDEVLQSQTVRLYKIDEAYKRLYYDMALTSTVYHVANTGVERELYHLF